MSRTRCRHVCPCGAVLICASPDTCAVGERWNCPTCELAAFDAYLQSQVVHQTPEVEERTTHDHLSR